MRSPLAPLLDEQCSSEWKSLKISFQKKIKIFEKIFPFGGKEIPAVNWGFIVVAVSICVHWNRVTRCVHSMNTIVLHNVHFIVHIVKCSVNTRKYIG